MKAIYINDCQYDFIDNEGKLVHSFKLNRPITFLDVRKLQLSSMIKGAWCNSIEEIEYHLSFIHRLHSYQVGILVNFFELFDNDSEKLISFLTTNVWESISNIQVLSSDMSIYLVNDLEKNEFLAQPIEGFIKYWRILSWQRISTVRDLANLSHSELLNLKEIGPSRAKEIESFLAEHGLRLKD